MQTETLERQLRDALHQTLDREHGPHRIWSESPAARRIAELSRRGRWPLRALAVAAVIGAAAGAALFAGRLNEKGPSNGWVAYAIIEQAPGDPDTDIWLAAPDRSPRRAIGSDTDGVDQACPAFSPDGKRLAYGIVEGLWSTTASDVPLWPAYRNAALAIADVAGDGSVGTGQVFPVGDGVPPPCPVWSPSGDRLAFGVPLTSAINPTRSGEGSEVWILRPADGDVLVIPDMLAVDLEWSPDGSVLAIVGGVETASGEDVIDGLQDGRIHLYELSTGTLRTLDDTLGAGALTWSPDGRRIVFDAGGAQPASEGQGDIRFGLRVLDLATGTQDVLANAFSAPHGIGPVWSPDGDTIAYQRAIAGTGERSEVVLITPDDRSARTGLAGEVVLPVERTMTDGTRARLYPWRVSWSPDGAYLLYVAWTYPGGSAASEETWVVAVPTDPTAPAVVLARDALAYDTDDTMRVQFQIWQRGVQ